MVAMLPVRNCHYTIPEKTFGILFRILAVTYAKYESLWEYQLEIEQYKPLYTKLNFNKSLRIFVEEVFLSLSNTFPDKRKVLVSKQKDLGGTNITTRTKFEDKNSLEETFMLNYSHWHILFLRAWQYDLLFIIL